MVKRYNEMSIRYLHIEILHNTQQELWLSFIQEQDDHKK